MEWLRDKDLSDVEAIIAYHGSSAFILRLARFCRQRGIRFMFDCTEWYDPRALPGGGWGLPAIDSEIRMRFVYPYVGRGIVISYYLENYYNKSGCNVARLPPLIDLQDEKWGGARAAVPPSSMSPLRIAYAGFPGKKDLLLNALRGLPKLKTLGIDVVLEIYGPTQSEFLSSINAEPVDDLLEGVIFHGRKRQVEIPALVASAHFSLLVRPDKRSSHAGFPTKLVESWAIGVPVIANITGDMGRYVVDGVNGVVLKDASTSAFVEAIKKIGALNLADYLMMRRNVQELAEKEFDFRNFIRSSAIAKLLENN